MQVSTPNAVVLSVVSVDNETPGKRTEEEALACSSLLPLVPPPMPILYLCHIGSIHAYAHVHAYAYAHPYAFARAWLMPSQRLCLRRARAALQG